MLNFAYALSTRYCLNYTHCCDLWYTCLLRSQICFDSLSFRYVPCSFSYPDSYYLRFRFFALYVSRSVGIGDNCSRIIACRAGCVQKLSADSDTRNSLVQICWRLVPGSKLFEQSYVCLCVGRWHHGVTSNCFPDPSRRVISISLNSVLDKVKGCKCSCKCSIANQSTISKEILFWLLL